MNARQRFILLMGIVLPTCCIQAQVSAPSGSADSTAVGNPWEYSITVYGYLVPDEQSYAGPTATADRGWLHLEARYNYENLRTGSLWVGYNWSAGKKWTLSVTPMIGGVFGRSTGIAPGAEASLAYKKLEFSISNEYLFDTSDSSGSFYYSWPQLTYSPLDWLHVGLVAQHTKAYRTEVDIQRGVFVGFSRKKWEFTAYEFNAGWTDPTVVLELGASF